MKYRAPNTKFFKIAFLFIVLTICEVSAQTKGLIVEPATGAGTVVLDPNGDGFSSATTGGFFTDDQIESEIPYSSLVFPSLEPTSDLSAGPNCSFTDFVDQGDQDPAQAYIDANGNWMFRLRMGSNRPNAKSYSILIDTDGKFGGTGPNADPQYSSSNPGFEIEIVLATKFGVYVYDVNNMNCTPVISYIGTTNYQKSIALTEVCGDADYFYDFFVKMSDLTSYFATSPVPTTINASTLLRMAIVDNMAALKSTLCNPSSASDIAGTDSTGSLVDVLTEIVNNYTPCAPGVVCPDRSLCPAINGPIAAAATSISITTTEAIGTIIRIYNGPTTLIGTSAPTTTSPQTLNVTVTAVSSGNVIHATAQAPSEGASINNCNTVTVAAPCLTGALTGVAGNPKGICGGGLTLGATLRIYQNGILIYSTSTTTSVIEITGTTWRFKPNGNFSNCTSGAANMATGYYEVSQFISGCEGPKVAYNNGTVCSGVATTPVITAPSPIYAGTATISGTSGASASIQLYIGGVLNSTITANGSGVWTSASVTVTAAQSVYVVATETGKCTSATSASVTVLTKPIPTILGTYCGSVTSVSGTVAATAGTIQLYRSPTNVAVGSPVAISSNGTWTVTGLSLVSANQFYAIITFPQGTTATSAVTTIGNQTTNAVAITTPTILEGATSLSGTGISGDTITLYIDGTATIYTATVNGSNNWVISPIPASEFYITALVSVTATTTGRCEGVPTATKTVQCVLPALQTYTGGSKSYCFGNAGFISLGSSELSVIYQLVNSSGVSVGPSAVGTGSAINLFTNALTANLTNVFVRAYKLVSPTCSVTSSVQINFDTQLPSASISLTSTNVSVLQGVTAAAFAFTNPLNTPTNYSIAFSVAARNAGFSNVGSTLLPASPINVVVPAAAPVGVYSAFLTITGGTACGSRYPITITVFSSASSPIISSQPASADRCTGSGASFSITAVSSLTITYRWESSTNGSTWLPIANGGVYSNATTSTLSISNVAGLDGYLYRGIATNTNGSATSVGATLNVNPLPTTFTVTGGGSYCSGGTGVAVGLANSTTGINYQLQLNGVDNGTAVAGTGSAVSFGLKTTAGTYTVIASDATTACTAAMTGSAVITINPTPEVPTVVVTAPTCAAAATNILSTYSASLTYTSTPTGLSVGAGGVITGGTNGTSYTITATNASLCSATTASFTYNGGAILETPAVPTVVVTAPTCASAATNILSTYSASLTYTSTPTGLAVGAGGVISGGTNGTSYTITATNASLCSATTASFTFNGGAILPTPAVPIVVVTAPTCAAAATNILSTYSASLTYTSTPTGLSVGAGGVITGGTTGTSYIITATNASLCSATTASFTYNSGAILSTPVVPTVVITAPTCAAAATNILSTYSASLTYTSTPTGLSVGAGGVITSGTTGTSYTITATNTSSCFATSSSFTFNGGAILPTPALPTVVVTAPTCASAATNILSTYSASLTYTSTPTGLSVGSGGVITGGTNGTSYTITATNASLCSATTASFTFNGGAILSTPAVPTVVVAAPTCASAATNVLSTYSASLTYTSTPTGLAVGTGGVITGGTTGTSYTITATNASSCFATSSSFTFNGGAILSTPAVPTVVVTAPTCASAATNILSTYSASLTYTSTPTGLSVGAGGVITGGTTGTSYTITATNASSCFATSSSFTFNGGAILSTPAVPTVVVTAPTCASAATNILSTYSASLTYTSTPTGLSVGAGGVIIGGTTGTSYTITATNASSCFATSSSFTFNGGAILPTPAAPTASTTIQPTCAVATGTIMITLPLGAGFEYNVDGGAFQSSTTFAGLAAGSHAFRTRSTTDNTCVSAPTNVIIVPILCGIDDSSLNNAPGANATVNVLANDLLSDGSPATPATTTVDLDSATAGVQNTYTAAGQGTWTYNPATGQVTFDPNPGFTVSPTAITYTLTEVSTGLTDTATITVTYTATTPPDATSDTPAAAAAPGVNVVVNVLVNDLLSDGSPATTATTTVDLDPATAGVQTTYTAAAQGTWTYNPATGQVTFDPNSGFTVSPTAITYTLAEVSTGLTDTASITVTYTTTTPPDATSDTPAAAAAGVNVVVNVLANDLLSDGSPATPATTTVDLDPATAGVQTTYTAAGQGTWTYNPATGEVTFDPNPGFTVSPTAITYTLAEVSTGLTDTASITVTYTTTTPPDATSDTPAAAAAGVNVVVNVLANDLLSDGSPATPATTTVDLDPATAGVQTTYTAAGQGTWTYNPATGEVTFDPNPGFTVSPTAITYTLTEVSTGLTDTATITVTYINGLPLSVDDNITADLNTSVLINVLLNDNFGLNGPNVGAIFLSSTPLNGNVVLNNNGTINDPTDDTFTYTPNSNYVGSDSFTYTIMDSNGDTSTATVTINIICTPISIPTIGTITQPTCVVNSGSVLLNNLPTGSWTINPGNISGNTSSKTISGLATGTYNFTVTIGGICASLSTSDVIINVAPTQPAVPTVVVTAPTCASAATNILSTYSASLTYTSTPSGLSVGAGGVITGGTNGLSYTIRATNASLCSATTASFTFNGGAILPTPAAFAVSGGGVYCSGGAGVAVGLVNSTTGINYQLQLNGVDNGTAVAGTGSPIGFGLKTLAGTYTVIATNNTTTCTAAMTGSAVITICSGGSIAATVWYDTNGDGIVDVGENGLQGVTVTLDPGTPSNAADDTITTTDASGHYIFNNLPFGTYTVSVNVSTIAAGIPSGYNSSQLVPTFDADSSVGTPLKSTIVLGFGQNNLDQNFAFVKPSDATTGGNAGGVESESLGDAISKIYVGRKKNSVPTEFVKSSKNLYNKSKFKTLEAYKGNGQTMLDMFPKELVAGNIANETSPKDILDYTVADQVLSVDFSIGGKTKAVVLGIKTSNKIYNHTKASCDRLRGAEILNIQRIKLQGYNFLMQGIKQRNGVVEYAVSFAVAKNNNDTNYSIQSNWYVNAYTKFNDVYNFQVWATRPADTQKLVSDIINNLKSYMPVNEIGQQRIPETYASKVYREKGELIVKLRSTKIGNTAEISMEELYSETANNVKFRDNTISTQIKQELRVDIADGYEYDGVIKVDSKVEDAFYHADGNWGLDFDKRYTQINNYFIWNNFNRKYTNEEYSIDRNVEIKATSEYDYLTVYKTLLPGTLSADYSEYKYLAFTAKGSGMTEIGLIKSSIEEWKSQYRIMVNLTSKEQTYYIPFDAFISATSKESMTPNDLTTLMFTFLPVEAKTKELDMFISNLKFVKAAGNDGVVISKVVKFDNSFLAYPNPSKGKVNLMLFSNKDTNADIILSDLLGRTIYKSSADLKVGRNELDFNFNIPSGTYILNVSSKDTDYGTSKIIFR